MVPNTPLWIGGLNYFVNLSYALQELRQPRTQPVIVGDTSSLPPPLDRYESATGLFSRIYSPAWFFDRFQIKYRGYCSRIGKKLHEQRVGVLLSLGARTGLKSSVRTLEWIADFQHRHLPEYFTEEEIKARNAGQAMAAKHAHGILVSSESARQDLCHFLPEAADKAHVLNFVATVLPAAEVPSMELLSAEYGIDEPYFHVPNQLWAHKNHRLVVDALRILNNRKGAPLVVCTGNTSDPRNPAFFNGLCDHAKQAGVSDRIRFLGIVPFKTLSAMMRNAVAIINPSRFEGWSTTVEEAKSIGKRILLSDIPVHREQSPLRGTYFQLDDAEALAALMEKCLSEFDQCIETEYQQIAEKELPQRRKNFARLYEDIVLRLI